MRALTDAIKNAKLREDEKGARESASAARKELVALKACAKKRLRRSGEIRDQLSEKDEKTAKAMAQLLRNALDEIEHEHEATGRHFRHSLDRQIVFRYNSDPRYPWRVVKAPPA
jgi:hypothetical protein